MPLTSPSLFSIDRRHETRSGEAAARKGSIQDLSSASGSRRAATRSSPSESCGGDGDEEDKNEDEDTEA
jgi:hypothetical protein